MLILTRKKGQSIVIDENIEIIISAIDGDQVKIGIVAPPSNKIFRKELLEELRLSNKEAVAGIKRLDSIKMDLADIET